MSRYAAGTTVSREQSVSEIEKILTRYGASAFSYGWQGTRAVVMFECKGRRIRFDLPMPAPNDREFTHTEARGSKRSDADAHKAWQQACRQRWRALALAIKAKLEATQTEITTFETEFMAHIVLPNGSTVGQFMLPQIKETYETGRMPTMLPALGHDT